MKRFYAPWEHYIIDDTYPDEVFKEIQRIVCNWVKPPPVGRCHIHLEDSNLKEVDFVRTQIKKFVHPIIKELVISNVRAGNIASRKSFICTEYNCQAKGHVYGVHTDDKKKVASLVTYISEQGDGTELYYSNTNYHSTIQWSPNRSILFLNGDRPHSFVSSYNYRTTLNTKLEFFDKS